MRAIHMAIFLMVFMIVLSLLSTVFNVSVPHSPEVNETVEEMKAEVQDIANSTDIPIVGTVIGGAKALRLYLKMLWSLFTFPYNLLVSYGCPSILAAVIQTVITLSVVWAVIRFLRGVF